MSNTIDYQDQVLNKHKNATLLSKKSMTMENGSVSNVSLYHIEADGLIGSKERTEALAWMSFWKDYCRPSLRRYKIVVLDDADVVTAKVADFDSSQEDIEEMHNDGFDWSAFLKNLF